MVKKNNFILLIIYVITFFCLLITSNFSTPYLNELLMLLFSYLIVGGMLCISFIKYKVDIINTFFIVIVLMLLIFSIAPIVLLNNNIIYLHGVNYMDGCIKGTMIYIGACFAFFIGYHSKIKVKKMEEQSSLKREDNDKLLKKQKIIKYMFLIWLFSFTIYVLYQTKYMGRSLTYIFSFGKNGTLSETADKPLKFLLQFGSSMIFPWLYILFNTKNKPIKIILTILMTIVYIANGYRYLFVIMGLSFMIIYYSKKNKTPSVFLMTLALSLALVFFSILGNIRSAIRNGYAYELKIDKNILVYTLQSNFNIYQPFYRIVKEYPQKYNYTFGESMFFDTAITFVPRAIWNGKPQTANYAINRAVRLTTNDWVVDTLGMATPNITEYYVDFGIIGVLVIMFIFGKFLKYITYKYKNNIFSNLIIYALIYALCFQFVTRGYTPSNFYLVIFMLWPALVLKKIEKSD